MIQPIRRSRRETSTGLESALPATGCCTPLKMDSAVSENEIQSIPITTLSSGAKEQVKGGGEEGKKMKEKAEKKGGKKEKKQQPVA